MEASRTQKATRSMSANGIYYIINVLIGLFNRRCLIMIMGIDYQGVNGLFSSVLSILELAELGIGTAIIYHLYKPLAENNIEQIKSIMYFYKKCYTMIAVVIGIIGCLLCTNIEFFVGITEIDLNLKIIFLLMLADIIGTYTFAYKRSILYADQKNYIVANVNTAFVVTYNIAQLIMLYYTHNYYLYLLVKIMTRIGSNMMINLIVNKEYPYLKNRDSKSLDKDILFDIKKKVKGLMCHKIGTFVVNGTDNIFISKFIDLATVGIYANYNYVITAVNSLLNTIIDGATGSVGNLLVRSEKEHQYKVFKEMNLLNLFISTSAISIFSVAIEDFISLFFGEQYTLQQLVLTVIIFNMMLNNQRRVWGIMKTAAGIQYEDRFIPLYEAVINLIMSWFLFKFFGLSGIFMGTIFTQLGVYFYTFPVLVAKNLLGISYYAYMAYIGKFIAFQAAVVALNYSVISQIHVMNRLLSMGIKAFSSGISSMIIFLIVFSKSQEFKDLFRRLGGLINAKLKKSAKS